MALAQTVRVNVANKHEVVGELGTIIPLLFIVTVTYRNRTRISEWMGARGKGMTNTMDARDEAVSPGKRE